MRRNLQISNLPEAGEAVKPTLSIMLIEKAYDKFSSRTRGELFMSVHFREFNKSGHRSQVETKIRLSAGGVELHASAGDWVAEKSLRSALNALEKEFERKISKRGK